MHGRISSIAAFAILICEMSTPVFASQFSAAPVQLSFTGYPPGMQFGWSSALSVDGNVAVLGGPGSSSNPGGAVLYTQSGGIWSDPIFLSMSSIPNGVQAGLAVAVAPDGSQAFVGVPDINTYTGAVYVYTESSGSWNNTPTRTPLPMPSTLSTYSSFGFSIATSSNGQTLVVGAPAPASGGKMPGAVYVYTLNGSSWGSPVALSNTGIANGSDLGASVAVSSNGQVIVAGAPQGSSTTAYVYTRSNGSWSGPVALSIPTGAVGNGNSVAISADGNEILTGAPYSNSGAGAAYLFTLNGTTWNIAHTFTAANSGVLGWCVGLSPDGAIAFFGNFTGNSGSIYASADNNGNWNTPASLSVAGVNYGDSLGFSLAVGQNGQMLLSGATGANANAGGGFVYESPAAVSLNVSASANPVAPGSNMTFNLTLTNSDQPTAFPATTLTNVVLTDTLPSGTSYLSSTAANGTCTDSGATVTCTLASLSPGNNSQNPWSPSITIKAPTSTGTLTNTLSASADQPLQGTTNISTTLTVSSTGSSGSSGKSGGSGTGIATLIVLAALLFAVLLRKKNAYQYRRFFVRWQLYPQLLAGCITLAGVFNSPVSATVLSSTPVQLSDYGMQQGQTLGWSLALSSDGQVAAGGAVSYNRSGASSTDYTGAAYVYVRTSGTWSSPITLSTTGIPTGSFVGDAIAVSPDGHQIVVGAQFATSQGGVYLYNETDGSWANTPTRAALTLPANMVGTVFGEGLAVSSNGQILLVGTRPTSGSSTGEIYAYTLSGSTWTNPVALPMTGIPNGADAGGILAVSANGQIVVAGVPQQNSAQGAVYVWTQNTNGTWKDPVALALPSTLDSSLAFFGGAVAISADGSEILAGATGANNQVGAAYVYTDTNGTWSSTPKMLNTTLPGVNSFGSSVALSPDGQTAFMGMPVNDTGYIFMSTKANSIWSTPVSLSLANLPVSAFLGIHLAQADNGEELLTTGYSVNNDTGALFVYDSPAAITLAGSPSAPAVAPGSSLTFNLTLTNADQPGGTPATTLDNVVLTDTLPTGTTYVSSNAANGTCSDSGLTVTCRLTSLTPGNNSQNPWSPSITVKTQSSAASLTNTLNMSANEPLVGSTSVTTKVTNDVVPTIKSANVDTATSKAVSGTLNATPGFTGQTLTFSIVSQPSNGSVTLTNSSTGAFAYTPNSGFSGTDSFVWTAGDGFVSAAPVAETITVGGSGGGSSGSSSSSGGGAVSIETLLLFSGLFGLTSLRKRRRLV
ncbi:MAG: Ig-like domain-containing protein [Gammaproteobacteria bacterium]